MYPDPQGRPVLCPTYLKVDDYVRTIRYLESLRIDCQAGCHWPLQYDGDAVREFLTESIDFVNRAESTVLTCLHQSPGGITMGDLIANVGPLLGVRPRTTDGELVYAINGQVGHLLAQGRIVVIPGMHPVEVRIISE